MSDFGDSVYGLINFRLILIRNYIFSNFDTFVFVSEDSTAIFSFKEGSGKVAQPFSLIRRPRGDLRGNLVNILFSSFYTFSQT